MNRAPVFIFLMAAWALGCLPDTAGAKASCADIVGSTLKRLQGQAERVGFVGLFHRHTSVHPGWFEVVVLQNDTPAAAAGLRLGDVIYGIGDVIFDNDDYLLAQRQLVLATARLRPGAVSDFLVRRGEELLRIPLEPGRHEGRALALFFSTRLPAERDGADFQPDTSPRGVCMERYYEQMRSRVEGLGFLGLRLRDGSDGDAGGLVVDHVYVDSAAEAAGLQPGDRLVELGSVGVESGTALRALWPRLRKVIRAGVSVRVTVLRGGERKSLEIRAGAAEYLAYSVLLGREVLDRHFGVLEPSL